jgi:hypothetical protein
VKSASGAEGYRFEPCRARQNRAKLPVFLSSANLLSSGKLTSTGTLQPPHRFTRALLIVSNVSLSRHDVPAIERVDTRRLTRYLRVRGTLEGQLPVATN